MKPPRSFNLNMRLTPFYVRKNRLKPASHNFKHRIKKKGKQPPISEFHAQLDGLGLKIIEVTADGNCFFRSLADQLEGNEENHEKNRKMVTKYIKENREMFEPFIEDEVPFEEYCQSMEQDGTWAGNMELQAASLVMRSNICIHRHLSPRWYIRNFDNHGARMIHLSYHDGEHYNSIRSKEDLCDGPAKAITIMADADLSAKLHQPKAAGRKSKEGHGQNIDASIKLVMAGTACNNVEKVAQLLNDLDGDVDAAIEFLIAEQGIEECSTENDGSHSQPETSYCNGGNKNVKLEPLEKELENDTDEQARRPTNTIKPTHTDRNTQKDEKKIPRNKLCPCGSKKKYKDCCGSVTGKSSTSNQPLDSTKSQKERKQGKKARHPKAAPAYTLKDIGAPPDMGALCI